MWAEDVANFKPYLRPFQNDQPNTRLHFRLSTTTRLSATNYLVIDAGGSTDQRQIEKAPDCNRTPPYLPRKIMKAASWACSCTQQLRPSQITSQSRRAEYFDSH